MDTVRSLGILSSWRGRDSTGIAAIDKVKGKWRYLIEKAVEPSPLFFEQKETFDFMDQNMNTKVVLGHTRSATTGLIDYNNAQPFKVPSVVGTHNGQFGAFVDPIKKDVTDSYHFYESLSKNGYREALEEARTDKLNAYALVWFDFPNAQLNMVRNKERPLYTMATADGRALFWASERLFLEFVDRKSATQFKTINLVDEDKLYTFSMNSTKWTFEDLKPKPIVQQSKYDKNWEDIFGQEDKERFRTHTKVNKELDRLFKQPVVKGQKQQKSAQSNVHILQIKKEEDKNIPHFQYYGVEGGRWSNDFADGQLSHGCYCCGVIKGKAIPVYWKAYNEYVCLDCYDDPWLREMEKCDIPFERLFTKSKYTCIQA